MRVRHIPTGRIVDWPDRFAAFQIGRHGDAYEPADEPKAKPKSKRKSTATDNGSDTVPGDTSEGGTPDSQE